MHFPGDDELHSIPTIRDFGVGLEDSDEGGKHLVFVSGPKRLAHFPAWDHADRDLRHFVPSDVPLGTMDEPYEDFDEGWEIAIFEKGGFVYVIENETKFRVPTDRYVQAWAAIIDAHNPITPLDDVDDVDE